MATARDRSIPAPTNPQWVKTSIKQVIESYGDFAVREQNKREKWNLAFSNVFQSWHMILARDSGTHYLLYLKARQQNDDQNEYQAIVWVHSEAPVAAGSASWTLVSFQELSSATTA